MKSTSFFCALLLFQVGPLAMTGVKGFIQNCTTEMDLTFVVDSSGSICGDMQVSTCPSWEALKDFVRTIVNAMTIGPNDVRVAMIEFESSAWIKWNLTTYPDKQSLLNAISALPYIGGNTNTIAALGNLSIVFSPERGDRLTDRNTAIMITDGKPALNGVPYPMDQIRAAVKKVTDQGIQLLTVGVTKSIDMETLTILSSPPHTINETVFVAEDYLSLEKVLRQLEIKTCINITDEPPTPAPEQPSCSAFLDLCFVVDASGSICDTDEGFDYEADVTCDNWKRNVEFIREIADSFDVGFQGTRIGLVTFASESSVRWNLTAYLDKPTLLSAISNLTYYKGGTTDMSGGTRLMRTEVFGLTNDRPDVPNTAIFITDGYPTIPSTLQGEIDACNKSGIRRLVVGVTNKIDLSTIRRLASPPPKENETYFLAYNYTTLSDQVRAQLSTKACPTPPSPTPIRDIPGSTSRFPTNPASTATTTTTSTTTTTTPTATPRVTNVAITPSPKTEQPQCNDASVDLCFLVDGSGSICDTDPKFNFVRDNTCDNWSLILKFLHRLITDIFSESFTRVGLVRFSTQSQTVFNLQRYTTLADIVSAVDNMTYSKGGTTDMSGAMHLARTEVFNTPGDRPGIPNTIVMLTDGYPTQPSTLKAEIDAAHNANIRILPLGVTDKVDESTLRRLSDPPHQINVTYFMALDFVDIDAFRKVLQEKICQPS